MTVITIPKILRDKLTDEGSEALVDILNKTEDRPKEHILEVAEGKFEKRLTEEARSLEVKISGVEVKIAQVQSNLIKWMFIFWVGQLGAITSILFAFFRK